MALWVLMPARLHCGVRLEIQFFPVEFFKIWKLLLSSEMVPD